MTSTFEDFAKEIRRIISVADERKIPLRILGGATVRMHCSKMGSAKKWYNAVEEVQRD